MKKYLALISSSVFCAMLVSFPLKALAAINNDPGIAEQGFTIEDLLQIIRRVANYLIILGFILAVIFIVWGGISYMVAGGDEEKAKKARGRIFNGIIGAAVVLGVGIIVNTLATVLNTGGGLF